MRENARSPLASLASLACAEPRSRAEAGGGQDHSRDAAALATPMSVPGRLPVP